MKMIGNRWACCGLMWGMALQAGWGDRLGKVVDFEDVELGVPPLVTYAGPGGGAYYNGSDGAGGFTSREVGFGNSYNADWGSWSGWAYSTTVDDETGGWDNQYSSYAGGAAEGTVYAVTYAPSALELPAGLRAPVSVRVTNTSYAAVSMRDGDMFAKKFGDDPATPEVETDYPDFFLLRITGLSESGEKLGEVEVYLADFRGDAEADGIVKEWLEVDLTPLQDARSTQLPGYGGGVKTIEFTLESSDVGAFGMNTPSYLAIDNLILEATDLWGPYDFSYAPWVYTGDWLGWVYVEGDWVYVERLERWGYLPEAAIDSQRGAWVFVTREGEAG